ncbi:cyclophane-containing peptide 2OG-Fe(II) oxygenase YhhC [Caulobacter soli]|uniref:cyclophane-containing peptide 2OG-Fe(II) oxygenase YhhC n=1 Tax=Caulobacter soli TaxID=2708539 RepID=UPI0013EC0C8D|nr:cyclophane-containing peptide 2OG-Fe(II) oxygenase YhhC [Caulobacter soli]
MTPDFTNAETRDTPFPHFRVADLLSEATADAMLDWLDADAPWKLRIASFYEQHEFSILACSAPGAIAQLVSAPVIARIGEELSARLRAPKLQLVDVCAHRLVAGQTIRVHNDYIGEAESHRLVVQLNRGWSVEQGGLLMLFCEDDPASVTDVLLPAHRSAFGFEISERSHHAVSTIHAGQRDTLVYTYRKAA